MFELRERDPRVIVVGEPDAPLERLAESSPDADSELQVDVLPPPRASQDGLESPDTDCVVVDGGAFDDGGLDLVRTLDDAPAATVLLHDVVDEDLVGDALAAGVAETLPRGLVEEAPDLVAERLASVVEDRRSERTYRQVFEHVSDGLVVHDPDTGEIRAVNDRYCEITGYPRDELVGESIQIIVPDDPAYTVEQAMSSIERAREEGPQLFEFKGQRRDGGTFMGEVHLDVVEVGGAPQVLASVRDITERKRREREFEQIFNGVNDAISVHDPETGEMLDVNDTLCELLGYDRETVLELGIEGVSVTEEGFTTEQAHDAILGVKETGEPSTLEWKVATADGDHRWLEVNVTPATIGGEERYLAIDRDITARRRTEQRLERIAERVDEVVYMASPNMADIEYISPGYEELWGRPVEEIREAPFSFIEGIHEEDREAYRTSMEAMLEEFEAGEPRERYEFDYRVRRPDGEVRWVDATAYPLRDVDGAVDGIVGLIRDVTERERSERRLRAILDRIDEAIYFAPAHELTQASQDPDYVSAGYEAIWGQPLDDIHERYPDGFFGTLHAEDEADYRAYVEGIVDDIDGGDAAARYTQEYRIRTPDDEVRWVQSDYYPVMWDGGSPRIVVVSRDVTDRKDRERRLVSFEEATDDLTTVDTPHEAARTAVEAATEALDLAAVGVFLYDEDAGVLAPEVGSDDLPGPLDAEPVGPADGALWEAFATGTIVGAGRLGPDVASGVAADLESAFADWRGIPLGNHGLLVVGSADRALASDTLQSAHVLGATLEAAFNHLQGQRQLASHREQLRTETERARRLDRITRLTQRVEAAITEATSAREIERAVCERLVETGPYEVAWIGGVEVGGDRVTARTVAGESDRYVDAMDLATTAPDADRHPAVEAWESDAVRVENTLVADGPAGEWRKHVLSAGYQSVCAVPLTYDEVTHGVLSIAAGSPNAFGDREREVLDQLGTSIGNALTAIERRRALESDETVELEFQGDGDGLWFADLATEVGCRVHHERTVHREDGDVSVFFGLDGDLPADVVDQASRRVAGTVEVVREEADAVLVEVVADTWFGAPLAESGAVLRRAEATPEETTVVVELPARADVRTFADRLGRLAPSLELAAKRHRQRADRTAGELRNRVEAALTDRQLEAVRTAFEAGYFEWPREHDGSEVADRLDITQPTFNKHLRLAEKKTFGTILDGES